MQKFVLIKIRDIQDSLQSKPKRLCLLEINRRNKCMLGKIGDQLLLSIVETSCQYIQDDR